ncbi:hypothetical protein DRN93_00270 [archaeon]|nr:MAG: hypothetical protein DRN93_00270 [archaeon]
MPLIADVHEPSGYKKGAYVEDISIDYIIDGDVRKYALERKTINDLWASVKDGRLWKQLETLRELKDEGYIPMLVIVGKPWKLFKFHKVSLTTWFAIQVSIASYGVGIIHLQKEEWFEKFLSYLKKRAGMKKRYRKPSIPKKGRSLRDERMDMLVAVDGIGYRTAEKLLDEIGVPIQVFNAKEDELRKIMGKRTDHFLEVLGRDKVQMEIVDLEVDEK